MPRRGALMPAAVRSIEQYLAGLPADQAAALRDLRKMILECLPGAEDCISYGMPAIRYKGKVLVAFAARSGHLALYPMSASIVQALAEELVEYDTSKGTIRFQAGRPLPRPLVRRIVKSRMVEILTGRSG